jgi:RNA polymerase sigma-70 factor (sigma-E family)
MHEPEGFREFVEGRSASLLRSAWLLTNDWHVAHDLVQTALLKTWPRWETLVRRDRPELYVRRVMLNTYLSWRERRWNGESPTERLPEAGGAQGDVLGTTDLRMTLVGALATLPPRQRATVVLRYFDDLTEADTAIALGCSVGTVKTQCSRAMHTLRTMPGLADLLDAEVS